jgi:hypothetical protein
MIEPAFVSYDLGSTVYGQPLHLTRCRDSAGKIVWSLRQEPACQRDEGAVINGIPPEIIFKMAEAIKGGATRS